MPPGRNSGSMRLILASPAPDGRVGGAIVGSGMLSLRNILSSMRHRLPRRVAPGAGRTADAARRKSPGTRRRLPDRLLRKRLGGGEPDLEPPHRALALPRAPAALCGVPRAPAADGGRPRPSQDCPGVVGGVARAGADRRGTAALDAGPAPLSSPGMGPADQS